MDVGKYIDFDEKQPPNTVWCLYEEDGQTKFGQKTISYALAGDTDSAYLRMPKSITEGLSVDDACGIADTVTDMINESYVGFAKMAFNSDRGEHIHSDREVVARRGLFLTKKRYVLDVVDDEGDRKQKRKITGLEIKKSDTSEAVKEILSELIDMILGDSSMEAVLSRVGAMRADFETMPIQKIATPCGVKSLGKLNQMFESTGSLKGAHYAAKAAFAWNHMKTDKEKEIYPGEKVGLVYIKGNKYNCIAFPIDQHELPEWFLKNPIDYDKMWSKANKKITNYLESVGWDLATRKEKNRKTLFGF